MTTRISSSRRLGIRTAFAATVAVGVIAMAAAIGLAGEPTAAGMPVPGHNVSDVVVEGDGISIMPVPGFVDHVDEAVVGTSGMVVPGYEGTVSDTVVETNS